MTNNVKDRQFDAVFYVAYPYYFPHFLPIHEYWISQGKQTLFVLSEKQNPELMETIAKESSLNYQIGSQVLSQVSADVFFFANEDSPLKGIKGKTVFLDHGVGTKYCDYPLACELYDYVLIEGSYRQTMLETELPQHQDKIKCVGFTKLDPVAKGKQAQVSTLMEQYGLDVNKKTILYAPTFFPSSIEKMGRDFPADFADCNVIVKPHYLSLERRAYAKQRKLLQHWATFSNCLVTHVGEYNLTKFIGLANLMISDESSAIFECTALDKPVVINRFLKLRWSYYLNPKKLVKRMDQGIDTYRAVGYNPGNYDEMKRNVRAALTDPSEHKAIRAETTSAICGLVDGNVSKRIFELFNEQDKSQ